MGWGWQIEFGWQDWQHHPHQILKLFPGLIHLHGSTQTCSSDIIGAGLTCPIVAAGAYLGQDNKKPLSLRKAPEASNPPLDALEPGPAPPHSCPGI